MSITVDDIEALRRVLAELPRHQPKQVSKQEAVALLASELSAAQRRGYKPDELAQLFAERGITINAATLRGYLRRSRKVRRRGGKTLVRPENTATPTPPPSLIVETPAVPVPNVARPAPPRPAAVGAQDVSSASPRPGGSAPAALKDVPPPRR
jgi:hypothetical protein